MLLAENVATSTPDTLTPKAPKTLEAGLGRDLVTQLSAEKRSIFPAN
jgi:hypothetical protein